MTIKGIHIRERSQEHAVSPLSKQDFLNHFVLTAPAAYPTSRQPRHTSSAPSMRRAAVLIGLVERRQGLQVIFTQRAHHLRNHPGEVSFPGGRYEPWDHSLAATAQRETTEEIGVPARDMTLIGQLPPLKTVSQFQVTPVLAFIAHDYTPRIDANEVADIFEVPAHKVFNPAALGSYPITFDNQSHRVFGMTHERHLIWGVTAQIIDALQRQLALPHR